MDGRSYILTEHRSLPEDERPVWTIGPVLYRDGMRAHQHCTEHLDPGEPDTVRNPVWMAARAGSQIRGVTHADRHPEMLGGPPVLATDRMRWIMRLPTKWISELSTVAATGGSLDPEEE